MPRKRKVKPMEQKTAEEFFPVDVDDLKRATEKIVKPMPPTTIIGSVEKTVESVEKGTVKIIKKTKKRIKTEKKPRGIRKTKDKTFSPACPAVLLIAVCPHKNST